MSQHTKRIKSNLGQFLGDFTTTHALMYHSSALQHAIHTLLEITVTFCKFMFVLFLFMLILTQIFSLKCLNRLRHACLSRYQPYIKPGQCSSTNYLLAKISLEDKHLQTLHWTVPDERITSQRAKASSGPC